VNLIRIAGELQVLGRNSAMKLLLGIEPKTIQAAPALLKVDAARKAPNNEQLTSSPGPAGSAYRDNPAESHPGRAHPSFANRACRPPRRTGSNGKEVRSQESQAADRSRP
jgi:hypothetical protein